MKRLIIITAVLASCIALYFVVSTLIKQNEPATSVPLVQKQILPQTSPIAEQKTIELGLVVTEMTETPLEEDTETPAETAAEETVSLPAAAGNKPVNIPSVKRLNTKLAVPQAANVIPAIFGSGSTTVLPAFEGYTNTTGPIAPSDESQPLPIPPEPTSSRLSSGKVTVPSAQPPPNIAGPVPRAGYTSQPLPAFTPVISDKGPVPVSNKKN